MTDHRNTRKWHRAARGRLSGDRPRGRTGGFSRLAVGLSALLAALVMLAAPGVAQEDRERESLAPSLVRSAVDSLESGSEDARAFALHLLRILADTGGRRAPLIEEALLEMNALGRVLELEEGASGELRQAAESARAVIERRLAMDLMADAELMVPAESVDDRWPSVTPAESGVLWVEFEVERGSEYELYADACEEVRVAVFDPTGTAMLATGWADALEPFRFSPPERIGRARARLRAPEFCATEGMGLQLTRRLTPQRLVLGEARDRAVEVQIGTVSQGEFEGDPSEESRGGWLRFQAEEGVLYSIATRRLSGGVDTVLVLYDEGEEIRYNDDGGDGLASEISWLCRRAGEYLVEVRNIGGADSGRFDFVIEERGDFAGAEQAGSYPEAGPRLVIGAPGTFLVVETDPGWASVELTAGTVYKFEVDGSTELRLEGPDLIPAPKLDDTFSDDDRVHWIEFLALASGSHELEISTDTKQTKLRIAESEEVLPFELVPVSPGELVRPSTVRTYLLELEEAPTMEVAEGSPGAAVVPPPPDDALLDEESFAREVAITVEVEPAKDYVFSLAGHAGEPYRGWVEAAMYGAKEGAPPLFELNSREMLFDWSSFNSGNFESLRLVLRLGGMPARVLFAVKQEVAYHGFEVGDRVVLGRHRSYHGSRDWNERMWQYVGEEAVIESLREKDRDGAWIVRVDIDDGDWVWRTRDLERAAALVE